jgi:hypothetical protein
VFLAVIDDVAHGFEPVFDSGLDELEVVVWVGYALLGFDEFGNLLVLGFARILEEEVSVLSHHLSHVVVWFSECLLQLRMDI